ncbi:MAG: hypothetical protein NVSMB22_27760 [Chloroflexota bacterium]
MKTSFRFAGALSVCALLTLGPLTTRTRAQAGPSAGTRHLVPRAQGAVPRHASNVGWKTYRRKRAGFAIRYPADWSAHTQVAGDGSVTVTFAPASGGPGVEVLKRASMASDGVSEDPNTRCQTLHVKKLVARQCLDTISLTYETFFTGRGSTYVVSASRKGLPSQVYSTMVNSFRLLP